VTAAQTAPDTNASNAIAEADYFVAGGWHWGAEVCRLWRAGHSPAGCRAMPGQRGLAEYG
jgi:hypothetical protein